MFMNPENVLSEYEKGLNTHNFNNVRHLIEPGAIFWFNEGSFEGIDEMASNEDVVSNNGDNKYLIIKPVCF